jgi:type IV pilus assembly protein PilO
MQDIKQAGHRFRIVLAVVVAICIGATGVLLSPVGTSFRAHRREIQQLQLELQGEQRETNPLRGLDRKVIAARDEVAVFYQNRLPSSYASVSEKLDAIASESGVDLTTGHFTEEPSGVPGLQRLLIDASISSDYLHAVKFINATERERMFFIIDGVSLTKQQAGIVHLQIKIEAFLKEA